MERYVITKNDYNFKQEDIFLIGKRANNPKRSFLFVSKLFKLNKKSAIKRLIYRILRNEYIQKELKLLYLKKLHLQLNNHLQHQ